MTLGNRAPTSGPSPRFCMLLVILALATAAACGADESAPRMDPIEFRTWDSAGVRISESSGHALNFYLPWRIDSEPDLELGRGDGESSRLFHFIGGMEGLPDGGIVVLDGGSQELRWFNSSGDHVFTAGGRGEGPGEFNAASLLPQFQGDSLLIFDTRSRRLTWFAKDGSGHRVRELSQDGRLLATGGAVGAGGSRVLFRVGSGQCIEAEYCEDSSYVRWVDPAQGVADTIAEFPRKHLRVRNSENLPTRISGPFQSRAAVAVGAYGPVVGAWPGYELREFDDEGRLAAITRLDAPARAASPETVSELVQTEVDRGIDERVVRDAVDRMGVPESVPAFQSIIVDRGGWYWAELYRLDLAAPPTWLVFDPRGEAHGLIETPARFTVYDIGENFILGRWIDDLGVEHVRRHALNRDTD